MVMTGLSPPVECKTSFTCLDLVSRSLEHNKRQGIFNDVTHPTSKPDIKFTSYNQIWHYWLSKARDLLQRLIASARNSWPDPV